MRQGYFSQHLSLSEWALRTKTDNRDTLVREDASKRQRLSFLSEVIGLPVVSALLFSWRDINGPSDDMSKFLAWAGEKLYAVRATPREDGLPVLRNRKLPVRELVNWLLASEADLEKYDFSFEQHIDPEVAAIFIIEEARIVGEAIVGGILQLNTGLHSGEDFTYFEHDFQRWRFSRESAATRELLAHAVQCAYVPDPDKQALVEKELGQAFSNNYLQGYYEVISSQDSGVVFIDYNRALKESVKGVELFRDSVAEADHLITGQVGCAGKATGRAKIVAEQEVEGATLAPDEILVCHFTSPEYVPLINQASAVVTDVGGILSHAAIVCRELKKPCVIGTKVGTQRISTGDLIEVDATKGVIRLL